MEEKKSIKISFSTFLLILAIITIVIMGIFIYKLSIEKINAEDKVEDLNGEINKLESTVNTLQGKIDSISNTINSNTNEEIVNTQENNNTGNQSIKFSEDEIKKCIQNYLDLIGSKSGSPANLLVKLNLINSRDITYTNPTSDGYIKTNIQYSEYKNAMLNYVTEEWFNTNFKNGFKEENGLLYYFNGGGTGAEFEVQSITLKGAYSDSRYIAKVYNIHIDESRNLENIEFVITNNNGKCVISYCD